MSPCPFTAVTVYNSNSSSSGLISIDTLYPCGPHNKNTSGFKTHKHNSTPKTQFCRSSKL